ncbi:MAG: hypothetical protein ACRD5L_00600, partial [Bryobacteraceae bacterium]
MKSQSTKAVTLGAILFLALGVAGCASVENATNAPPPGGTPTPTASPAASVSFCNQTNSGCATGSTFGIGSTQGLNITVNWQDVPAGLHTQTLRVLLPGGGIYDFKESNFQVASVSSGATVHYVMPVAGTDILLRRMTGAWNVQVSLDGKPLATQGVQFTP